MKTYADKYELAAGAALAEVLYAKDKWPPFNSAHEGFAVLLEEVDELKAHVWTRQSKRDIKKMRAEAIQVAAMAIAFAAEVCTETMPDHIIDHLVGEHGRVLHTGIGAFGGDTD